MGVPIVYDPKWSLPNADDYIRRYLAEAGVDVKPQWEVLGEMAVLAARAEDEKTKLGALRSLASYIKVQPRAQDVASQGDGGVRPLHIGLAEEILVDGEYCEIEEEADREYREEY